MPTIPNFLRGTSPLGTAFANLSSTLQNQPSDAQNIQNADNALLTHRKVQGQQGLADFFANTYNGQPAPAATPPPAVAVPQAPANDSSPTAGEELAAGPAQSPISQAFAATAPQAAGPAPSVNSPNFGAAIHDAIFGGIDPKTLGGYNLFGAANTTGARSDATTNATVGAGDPYKSTAQSFDIEQGNDMTKAANTNATSRANNADTNTTSRSNNAATNSKDLTVEQAKLAQAEAGGGTGALDPSTVKYLADQVRMGAPLPALGMGKQAAAMRAQILTQAAADDTAASRTGTDAAVAKADYAGNLSESRNLGTRSGQVGNAVNELAGILPTTKALIGTVARTGLYPVDAILNAAQHGTNDPQLSKLAVSINDAVNAHARAINPQGQVTDAGRAQGYALLNQVQSPDAMGAALDQMMVGAQRALHAPAQTRQQLHDSMHGTLGGTPAPAGGAPTATKVIGGVAYHQVNGQWMQE